MAEGRTDVKVGKVVMDDGRELAGEFGVIGIPTLLVFEQEQKAGHDQAKWVPAREASVLDLLG